MIDNQCRQVSPTYMAEHRLNLFASNNDANPSNENPGTQPVQTDRRERELDRMTGTSKPKTMSIPLGVMIPLLMKAAENDHRWLDDFSDDVVQIDADLHEVLMAFQNLPNQPSLNNTLPGRRAA